MKKNPGPRIVVATPVPAAVLERLSRRAEVLDLAATPRAQWDPGLGTAWGLLVNSGVPVDAALLAAAPRLQIVATSSVGYDNIDRAALVRRGIALTNSRGSLDEAVADLAFVLVLAAMRRLGAGFAGIRAGRWSAPLGHDLAGATLGIVGLGAIGGALARRAQVSGMHVIYANRRPRSDDAVTGAKYRPFATLLAEADCVALLVPLTAETRGMFDDATFAAMKPGATLVNAARGAVVDTAALVRALQSGRLAGAALDVVEPDPLPPDHPLLAMPEVLIAPHAGSATVETRARMTDLAASNLLAALDGAPLPTPVVGP